MSDAKARRRWLRCAAKFPVNLQALDSRSKKMWAGTGSTINIGGGGAMLDVRGLEENLVENLIKGKYSLQMALHIRRISLRVKLRANVVWVEEFQRRRDISRTLGITFKRFPKKAEDRLIDYVEDRVAVETADYALSRSFHKTSAGKR